MMDANLDWSGNSDMEDEANEEALLTGNKA